MALLDNNYSVVSGLESKLIYKLKVLYNLGTIIIQ